MTIGPLLTAATINSSFLVIAAWVFFRRLGLTAMLWAGVLLLAVMWSGGSAVLSDTLSSSMTMYSVLCTAVLAWALIDGDIRLLPLAVSHEPARGVTRTRRPGQDERVLAAEVHGQRLAIRRDSGHVRRA